MAPSAAQQSLSRCLPTPEIAALPMVARNDGSWGFLCVMYVLVRHVDTEADVVGQEPCAPDDRRQVRKEPDLLICCGVEGCRTSWANTGYWRSPV